MQLACCWTMYRLSLRLSTSFVEAQPQDPESLMPAVPAAHAGPMDDGYTIVFHLPEHRADG